MGQATSGHGKRHHDDDDQAEIASKKLFNVSDAFEFPSALKSAMPPAEPSSAGTPSVSVSSMMASTRGPRSRTFSESVTSTLDRKALPTVFRWEGAGQHVAISGSFNNWSTKIPLIKSHGDWVAIIQLPEGVHRYKYYVDGDWRHDENAKTTENEHGSLDNIISVQEADFEVFRALDEDIVSTGHHRPRGASTAAGAPPGTPPELNYGQSLPPQLFSSQKSPPALPPHLLQVILNKDVPLEYEPSLLPEPNHVMLNHMYALSIKDSVMVLSATHRLKKKYITTLFYKPLGGPAPVSKS